jgi:maltose alpha-D-glucosyltransferase / alpha-amylase
VTTIWLLPFFKSPLRDDGYDIADYTSINPAYGTLRDFETFLREAHRRELRVITELVMNHTSDQHEWFQKSRRAKPGEKWRDFYVWSDTDDRYREARIIFQDFEMSNWSWDPVAGAYYWHRFYHHQPDLNFDNPEVHEAMFSVRSISGLSMGVDGVRLDAVPYLYEREGTNCENLPETHAFLKKLRKHVDDKYSRQAAAGRGQPVARGRVGLFRRWRRVPHELPFPAHAATVHGDRAGGSLSGARHPRTDAADPRQLPVGDLLAES